MNPISVLIPVYNGEKFLQESLDSLYRQSFQNFEIILVDDGSTDKTASIIAAQNDRRIKYYRNEHNSGIVITLNKGLTYCNGKYIVRMDADDIALPERLEKQWHFMETHPDVVLCGSSINRFSESYSILDARGGDDAAIRARLLFDTAINHPSAIIRTKVLRDNGLNYPSDYLHAEDYGLWYALSKYGKLYNLAESLVRYRMHGDNVSMKYNHLQYQTMNRIRFHIMRDFWEKVPGNQQDWMEQYEQLLSQDQPAISEFMALDKLLMQMIAANRTVGIYDDLYLKESAAWFWYVVFFYEHCDHYNPGMVLRFIFNPNSICRYLGWAYRKKFLMKSLLCWKK